ncbi:MAG: inner membrane protein YgaZ [Pseudomonadota bacterium]|jgi:predicted branched-subunit amino acid permease
MFWQPELYRHPQFREGMRDILKQTPGVGAWGLMTGVYMVKAGMSLFEAVAMTLLVFAGSSQLAAIPLLMVGAPAWVIFSTGFCVNLRFVVFSLHLRPYLMHLSRWRRWAHGYLTADISYVLFTRRFHAPPHNASERLSQEAYLAGTNLLNWGSWMASSLVGVALANFIPPSWGLGFAGILCLLGIQCSLASTRLRLLASGVAGAAAVAAYALPLKLNIVFAIVVAVVVSMTAEQWRQPKPESNPS